MYLCYSNNVQTQEESQILFIYLFWSPFNCLTSALLVTLSVSVLHLNPDIFLFLPKCLNMSSLFWPTSFPSLHILDLSLVAEEASSSVPGLSATGSSLTLAGLSPSLLPYIKGHGVKITAKITQLKSWPANKPHICFSSQLLEAQVDSSDSVPTHLHFSRCWWTRILTSACDSRRRDFMIKSDFPLFLLRSQSTLIHEAFSPLDSKRGKTSVCN